MLLTKPPPAAARRLLHETSTSVSPACLHEPNFMPNLLVLSAKFTTPHTYFEYQSYTIKVFVKDAAAAVAVTASLSDKEALKRQLIAEVA